MDYLRLSWDDIQKQCETLAEKIKEQKVAFDLIIGIARGGWVPARLLSDILDNDELYTVRVKFYDEVARTKEKPIIAHPTQVDVTGKRVLVVDDIADTGESLLTVINHLRERRAGSIFVATLVKKPSSKFTPDIFVLETPAWVVFPWEVRETVRSILRTKKGVEATKELKRARIKDVELEP
ncbi:MAG: phosphoribosyltransferase [Candidatus Hydrothermarchaeaceae archaeon]